VNFTNCVISTDLALQEVKSIAMPKALTPSEKYTSGGASIEVLKNHYGTEWINTSVSKLKQLAIGKKNNI
jgi:hypothetical protein